MHERARMEGLTCAVSWGADRIDLFWIGPDGR